MSTSRIVIGTTPTIMYSFSIVKPTDFVSAVLTIKKRAGEVVLRKELTEGFIVGNSLCWKLSQEDTLGLETRTYLMRANWLTADGTRGVTPETHLQCERNHINEVMT